MPGTRRAIPGIQTILDDPSFTIYSSVSMDRYGDNPIRRLAPAVGVVLTMLMALGGCEAPPPEQQSKKPQGEVQSVAYWKPEPMSVRVYPSTRFIQESGRAILEARFELFDEMGDPVKASGTFHIELYSIDEALGNAPRRLLYTWNAQTLTLDQQREHYDPIMRGYLFRLGVDNLRIVKQATLLKVAFTPVDRPRLEVEAVVKSDW